MTDSVLSVDELEAEVVRLGDTLATSDGDTVSRQAEFVQRLAELEACAPDLERVETELDRLVAEAATLAFGATPQQAMGLVRDLAELREPLARLNALGSMVSSAASRLAAGDGS